MSFVQMRRLRPTRLKSLAQSPTANQEQRWDHSFTHSSCVRLGGRALAPCSLGSPATASRAGKSGQVALPVMATAARQEAPGGLRVEGKGRGTEGVDMLPLRLLPMISRSVRPSSTGPTAVPFSTVPSVIQATGTSCLESQESPNSTLRLLTSSYCPFST